MKDFAKLVHDGHPIQIKSEDLPWVQIQEGIECKVLYNNAESAHWSILQRAKAGTVLPYHLHHAPSIFWILEGEGTFPDGTYGPGDYFFEPAGYHYATTFETDSTVLFHSYGGVTFFEEDRKTPRYHLNHKYLSDLMKAHNEAA